MIMVSATRLRRRNGFRKTISKAMAAALGLSAALIADLVQKSDASAMIAVSRMVNSNLNMSFPLYYWILAVLLLGMITVFLYEPMSKRNAFYAGAGVLAFIMAWIPVQDTMPLIPSTGSGIFGFAPASGDGKDFNDLLRESHNKAPPVQYILNEGSPQERVYGAPGNAAVALIPTAVRIVINIPMDTNQPMPELNGQLFDAVSEQTYRFSDDGHVEETADGYRVSYQATLSTPRVNAAPQAHVFCRVESKGYKIVNMETVSQVGETMVLEATMVASRMPNLLQRLGQAYKN